MSQIRRRHVNVQVTSATPTNKVFKGIYADSEYTMLLSSNKSYEFDMTPGQSKELYIRYSQKPVTITFKGVAKGSYKVTGNFGEVNVSSEDVTANVEFLTDSSPYVDVTFTSIESTTEGYEIGDMRVGGALVHSLPYYLQNAVPGQKIEVSVEVGKTTTTTTKSPVTLTFTGFPKNSEHGVLYTNVEIDGASNIHSFTSEGYLQINSIKNNVKISSINNQDDFSYTSVNIDYLDGSESRLFSEELTIPCTIDLTDQKFAPHRPSFIQVTPGEYIGGGGGESDTTTTSTTSTSTRPGVKIGLSIQADPTTVHGNIYPLKVDISGGDYAGTIITVDSSSYFIPLLPGTRYTIKSIQIPQVHNNYIITDIIGTDGIYTTIPYSFTTPSSSTTISITVRNYAGTTTSTPAPATLTLQSNIEGTTVNVKTENTDEDVSLSGTTPSTINIDMKDAPLVDV